MRGTFNFIGSAIFNVREFGWKGARAHATASLLAALSDHFGVYQHSEGVSKGAVVYARLPFTRRSALVEWSDISLGRGVERSPEGRDIFLGRLKVSLCHEQGELYRSARGAL